MTGPIRRSIATAFLFSAIIPLGASAFGSQPIASSPTFSAAPAATGGSCVFKSTEIATADSYDETTSTSFVNLKDAGLIAFRQVQPGCVAGAFYANAGNETDSDHVLLQVLLDGVVCAPLTGGYIFANGASDVSSHTAAFFCGAKVAVGKHKVQVRFSSGQGSKAEFFQRTLEVSHH